MRLHKVTLEQKEIKHTLNVGDEIWLSRVDISGKVVHIFDGRKFIDNYLEYTILCDTDRDSKLLIIASRKDDIYLSIKGSNYVSSIDKIDKEYSVKINNKSIGLLSHDSLFIEYTTSRISNEIREVKVGDKIESKSNKFTVLYITPNGSLVMQNDLTEKEMFIGIDSVESQKHFGLTRCI